MINKAKDAVGEKNLAEDLIIVANDYWHLHDLIEKLQSRSYSVEKAKEDISQLLSNGFGEDNTDISIYIHSRLAGIGQNNLTVVKNNVFSNFGLLKFQNKGIVDCFHQKI